MKKIIVIVGPTCAGKTRLAVDLAKKQNGEIVSADSRQIYKYLDIGSNKEGKLVSTGERIMREIDGVPQYLTDILEPDKYYSAADFVKDADACIDDILSRNKTAIVCGGTGLYIKALLYGLNIMPPKDEALREKLRVLSAQELYEKLLELDPLSANKNKGNPQRLLRALEVNIISKKTMQAHFAPLRVRYDFTLYNVEIDRQILYSKINSRCRLMIERGMLEEAQKVLSMGYKKTSPALTGLGYKMVCDFVEEDEFIDGMSSHDKLEKLIADFSTQTRHYAKRQMTWFRTQMSLGGNDD